MKSIKGILDKVWKGLEIGRKEEEAGIWQYWRDWIGEEVSKHSQPQFLTPWGKLVVNVDSSVWVEELTKFRKKKILKKLNQHLRKDLIKEIYFRVGELK